MPEPEESLVRQASRGDAVAVQDLLERHLSGLRAFIRLRSGPVVRSHESQSDLVQSVCREVLGNLSGFEYQGDAAFRRWLYTTALHKIVEKDRYWRSQKRDVQREAQAPADPDASSSLLSQYGHLCTPSREAAANEQVARIEAAFEKLPDDYREVLTLARVAGLPHAEIAKAMNRSEESCRTLLRRARIKLSEILAAEGLA